MKSSFIKFLILTCFMKTTSSAQELKTVTHVDLEKYAGSWFEIEPKVVIPSTVVEERIRRVFEMSEKACAISNSIKSKISLVPIVIIN